jgi:hypothetical protein
MPKRSAVALVISVSMKPGAIALAVTPNLPSSMAKVLVKPCTSHETHPIFQLCT